MKNKTLAIRMAAAAVGIMMMAGICAGQTYWKKTYGGNLQDRAGAITPTPDGNFIVAGSTSSFGAGGDDVYLLKIKPDGDTLWTKTYGGTNDDGASAITPTPDGNFIVAATTYSFGAGRADIYLLKIKPNGDTLWTKTYGGTASDFAYAITPTPDGNFIIAGCTDTLFGGSDAYLLKINSSGDTLWTKTYGGTSPEQASVIIPTPDGNFIIAGWIFAGVYLIKIKPNGDTLWTKTYGGTGSEQANAITPTPDGNFIVAGWTNSVGVGGEYAYVLKINSSGDTLWTKTFGRTASENAFAITPTPDGNFIVVGRTYSFSAGGSDVYFLKITSSGDTLWTKIYGGTVPDYAYAITPTPDGNFIVAGFTSSSYGHDEDALLISIINDRYAYKSTLFTFKIPVYDTDSLSHGYTPLKVPAGMTVSLGGTISWTPTTDSVYMDHVEFLVSDDLGKKDTLTFNIFVNSKEHPTKAINPSSGLKNQAHQSGISISTFSSYTVFTLPVPTGSLAIYDIHGRLIQKLSITNNTAVWHGKIPAGRYFAKMTDGKRDIVKPFMVVK